MKAITLWQPWSSLIALGVKQFETRSWATSYRGPLAIHAAKRPMSKEDWGVFLKVQDHLDVKNSIEADDLTLGAVVAIAQMTECYEMTPLPAVAMKGGQQISLDPGLNDLSRLEMMVGLWEPGRFAWKLEDVRVIEPVFMNGRQGLWNCDLEVQK